MLRLAVTTRSESFERMVDPLAERGVAVEHLQVEGQVLPLTDPWERRYDAGFVFPSRLAEGDVVAAALDLPWVNDRAAVATSRNKGGVVAALAAEGLPVPETRLVSTPADRAAVRSAADDLGWPVVVKPNSTTRGVGVARVEDPDSLAGVVDYLDLIHEFPATGDRSYLLQEYLPDARDYRAMVVDGEYAGAVERRLPDAARGAGRWKHNVHRGAQARGVSLPERHRRLAERVASTLDVPFLGVDLLETADRLVVSETNARPTVDAASKYEEGFYDRLAALVERRV